jgi:hypothetical protein
VVDAVVVVLVSSGGVLSLAADVLVSGSRIEPMRSDIEEGDTRTPFVEKDKQYPEPPMTGAQSLRMEQLSRTQC